MSETSEKYSAFFRGSKYEEKWLRKEMPAAPEPVEVAAPMPAHVPEKRQPRFIVLHPDCVAAISTEEGPTKCSRCGYTRTPSDTLVLYARCGAEG